MTAGTSKTDGVVTVAAGADRGSDGLGGCWLSLLAGSSVGAAGGNVVLALGAGSTSSGAIYISSGPAAGKSGAISIATGEAASTSGEVVIMSPAL